MGYSKYSHDHKDYITRELIIEALSRFEFPCEYSSTSSGANNICYDLNTILYNIQSWLENDLKLIIEIKNINVYGHKRYYAFLYRSEEAYHNRFPKNIDINKEIKPNGVEFKAENKNNGREVLFHSEEQLYFAIFEYALKNFI